MVTADETGWRVGAVGHWLWAAVTPTTTVYAICAGRGFDDAQTVLGADFDGVLVRDGWVVYRRYTNGEHQSCLQHLRRRCEHLQEDHPHSGWAGQVQDTLQAGLALRDRRDAGGLSEHGLATARGRLLARISRLIDNPPPLDDAERFAAHMATEFSAIFTFLWDPSVDATNWRAEQAIRPAVVTRKVCGGNRTRKGADTQQVLASVVRTARQRNLDLPALFATDALAVDRVFTQAVLSGVSGRLPYDEIEKSLPDGGTVSVDNDRALLKHIALSVSRFERAGFEESERHAVEAQALLSEDMQYGNVLLNIQLGMTAMAQGRVPMAVSASARVAAYMIRVADTESGPSDTRTRIRTVPARSGARQRAVSSLVGPAKVPSSALQAYVRRSPSAPEAVAVDDGSSFTTASEKNPTLTILALAWRAADYLAEELRAARL